MLGKLLKYEIPALGRKLVPLYIGWAVTAALLGLAVGPAASKSDFMVVITAMLYSAVAAAVLVMAVVMIIQRYSRSLLGDEAYFNLVLPVTATEHIASKALSALIWILLSGVAMLLTGLIIVIFSGSLIEVFKDLPELFRQIIMSITGNEWLILLEVIILYLFSTVKSVLAIYAAITIGHQAQKHSTIASIGAYIGVLWLETLVGRAAVGLFPKFFMNFDIYQFHILFLGAMIVTGGLMALYFFICKDLMEKRLNLN